NVSVADLFVAGIIPGILLGVLLMANNTLLMKLKIEKAPPPVVPSLPRLKSTFLQGFPALLTPIVILRSMTTGLVTPTEASVLALLVMGIFLEAVPVMLIAVPLFGPLIVSYGVDPVQFGVVLTFAILLGIVHPPIGLGIFAVCAITKLRMEPVVRATLLFYPVFVVCLLLL